MIIARGKRGTSAARGYGRKISPLFSLLVWRRLRRAKPEEKKRSQRHRGDRVHGRARNYWENSWLTTWRWSAKRYTFPRLH
jgi:hypothetical protein